MEKHTVILQKLRKIGTRVRVAANNSQVWS